MKHVSIIQNTQSEWLGLLEDHLEGRGVRFGRFQNSTENKQDDKAAGGDDGAGADGGAAADTHCELRSARKEELVIAEIGTEQGCI